MGKVGVYFRAYRVARKHVVNWFRLLLLSVLKRRGVFVSRAGGRIECDAVTLLRTLVRLEDAWRRRDDVLPVLAFGEGHIVVSNYFGRELKIPLNYCDVVPPSFYLKYYPVDVRGDVVLDVGAYLGDTPLLWLYKGAEKVVAVEPVPMHYDYLVANVVGLPVIPIKATLGVRLPDLPEHYGSIRYGLFSPEGVSNKLLDVPVVDLIELVKKYAVTAVKLNCEGCEHFVLKELAQLPSLGVKKIIVQFHDIKSQEARVSYEWLRQQLGDGRLTSEKTTCEIPGGIKVRVFTVIWDFTHQPPP